MTTRLPCMALDVRSVLQRPTCELRGFTSPDGTPLSPRQTREALIQQLSRGVEVLTICITINTTISSKE